MSDYISMFIDDELGLQEKIEFLKTVHEDKEIYVESIELLEQEKLLTSDILQSFPRFPQKEKINRFAFFNVKPLIYASVGALAVIAALFIFPLHNSPVPNTPHRFIIYKPDASNVEISGSFIDWKVLPLSRIGSSGYWQIELNIPAGEHRYTYIIGGEEKVPDPTILTREQDDFGGENSILLVDA